MKIQLSACCRYLYCEDTPTRREEPRSSASLVSIDGAVGIPTITLVCFVWPGGASDDRIMTSLPGTAAQSTRATTLALKSSRLLYFSISFTSYYCSAFVLHKYRRFTKICNSRR
nr:hypothetical protein CFP56_46605 [Quercus suber]